MPYAAGVFSLVAGNPVVTGTIVSSTWANNTLTDIATGLSTAILKDGTQTATAQIPFGLGIIVGATGVAITSAGVALAGGSNLSAYIDNTGWLPGIKFGATTSGITYNVQSGTYMQIGKLVHAPFLLQLTSRGSSTGAAVFTGLPVQSGNAGYCVANTDWNSFTSSMLFVQLSLGANATTAAFKGMTASATSLQSMTMAQFAENSLIQGALTYMI
jgi:hypothetical protein